MSIVTEFRVSVHVHWSLYSSVDSLGISYSTLSSSGTSIVIPIVTWIQLISTTTNVPWSANRWSSVLPLWKKESMWLLSKVALLAYAEIRGIPKMLCTPIAASKKNYVNFEPIQQSALLEGYQPKYCDKIKP